ncbi:MAG: phage tail tape measure protein [Proteobacteria bacterium]|nr:phage tail tape measure protein [Pseudomonadota bacterium]
MSNNAIDSVLNDAAQAFADFANGPVASTSAAIERTVNSSFNSVANTIARAAVSGKTSMSEMVDAILADFDRVAVKDFIAKPVEGLISDLASSLFDVAGGRAVGGPVTPGATYLVGEQGPELFTPSENGAITSNANLAAPSRASIVLNVNARDAQSFLKSESQIAAMMSRALARGQRNL